MTKLFEKFNVSILENHVEMEIQSKAIKAYLDYTESKYDSRQFIVRSNQLVSMDDGLTRIGKWNNRYGVNNMQWLKSQELDDEIFVWYDEPIVKPDFMRWLNTVKIQSDTISREIESQMKKAIELPEKQQNELWVKVSDNSQNMELELV